MFLKLQWNCRVFSSETTPIWTEKLKFRNTVDGRNPAPGEVGKFFPIIYKFLYTKRWLFYFRSSEPSTPVYRLTMVNHLAPLPSTAACFRESFCWRETQMARRSDGLYCFHQIWTRKRDSFLWPSFLLKTWRLEVFWRCFPTVRK